MNSSSVDVLRLVSPTFPVGIAHELLLTTYPSTRNYSRCVVCKCDINESTHLQWTRAAGALSGDTMNPSKGFGQTWYAQILFIEVTVSL